MISVLLECKDQEADLAWTLAALVPGAVEGLVREVIVIDRESQDGSRRVAEAAGCRIGTGLDAREAVMGARSDWIFIMECGARPGAGWIEHVGEHLRTSRRPVRFRPAGRRILPLIGRLQSRREPVRYGLLVPKGQALEAVSADKPLASIASKLSVRHLSCEMIPAGG